MKTRVGPGSGFPGPLKSARVVNGLLEAAEYYQKQKRLGDANAKHGKPLPGHLVKVKNSIGSGLRLGEIVELADDVLTDIVRAYPWFEATAAPDETKQFAICLEPIPASSIGLCQISGVCPALVNFGATTDLWAYVSSGADVLVGDRFWGDVRILSTPAGTGERLVWVKIEQSPQSWLGKTDASHAVDASGTVSVWSGAPGSETDTGFNITGVYNRFAAVATTKWVTVTRLHRKPYLTAARCGP